MCVRKKNPPERIDFFSGTTKKTVGARAHRVTAEEPFEGRNPGMSVNTGGRSRSVAPRNSVPRHRLETAGFAQSDFVYRPCSDLPHMGWIQNCLFCDTATTCTADVGNQKGYFCGKCLRSLPYGDQVRLVKAASGRQF